MINVYEDLADSSRRAILAELRTGTERVSDIVEATRLKQPNVSNHLAKLRGRGIVDATRVGREIFYNLSNPDVAEAVNVALSSGTQEVPSKPIEHEIDEYADAAINGDETTCASILDRLMRSEVPLLTIYTDFLTPAMTIVGDRYQRGEINEAQEHLASAITERMMAKTMHSRAPRRKCNKLAILGLARDNWHSLGLRMVSDYLKLSGWRVLYLGPNVPTNSFLATVREHQPNLVLTSCSTEESISATSELVSALRQEKGSSDDFSIIVGGGSSLKHQDVLKKLGADQITPSLQELADTLSEISNGRK